MCPAPLTRPLAACLAFLLGSWALNLRAELRPENVLVVYQSGMGQATDGQAIVEHYQARRPGVWTVNLADYGVRPFDGGGVGYSDFASAIRGPIRQFLLERGLAEQIRVIALTKGIPHRVRQLPPEPENVGDTPQAAHALYKRGNVSYASVDSELSLLWHDLERNEAGGSLDSKADSFVLNPYYGARQSITEFDSRGIADTTPLRFLAERDGETSYWRMAGSYAGPGRVYLTCRLDGNSLEDVLAMIDRGQSARFDPRRDLLVLDASEADLDEGDLAEVNERFMHVWPARVFNEDATFLTGAAAGTFQGASRMTVSPTRGSVALLSGYGVNHGGEDETGWLSTFEGQLANGAIFNTWESYNGRKFGGQQGYVSGSGEHAQLADWISHGGTFGMGHVWEPFSFSVGRNVILADNLFVQGLTWIESAWSSLVALSWQNVVVGDPLAKVEVNLPPLAYLQGGRGSLEAHQTKHALTVRLNRPFPAATVIHLRFQGATLGKDFVTDVGSLDEQGETSLTILGGQTEARFEVRALDDQEAEGLELLRVEILPSRDQDGDGLGDTYGFLAPQAALIGIADGAFDLWRYREFGEAALDEDGLPEGDPDEDKLSNLAEYALGRDPHRADADPAPIRQVGPARSPSWMLTLPKVTAWDVRYLVVGGEERTVVVTKEAGRPWPNSANLYVESSATLVDQVWISGKLPRGPLRLEVEAMPQP